MKPFEVAKKLRRIATTIEKSINPDKLLVASDIRLVLASVRQAGMKEIREEISHATDGPVTDFVLISRAMDVVKAGANPDEVANVLHEELTSRGFLKAGQGYDEPSDEMTFDDTAAW